MTQGMLSDGHIQASIDTDIPSLLAGAAILIRLQDSQCKPIKSQPAQTGSLSSCRMASPKNSLCEGLNPRRANIRETLDHIPNSL
jgi:hypothetical protein